MADATPHPKAAVSAEASAPNSNPQQGSTFKYSSSTGKLEKLGLTPIRKVQPSPFKKRNTALDRHRTLVLHIQKRNRRHALQQQEQQQADQATKQVVAEYGSLLRTAILNGQDLTQTWAPIAKAAATLEHQEQISQEQQQVQQELEQQAQMQFLTTGFWLKAPKTQAPGNNCESSSGVADPSLQAEADDFVETLLATAATTTAAATNSSRNCGQASTNSRVIEPPASSSSPDVEVFLNSSRAANAAAGGGGVDTVSTAGRPGTSQGKGGKGKSKPAWALSSTEAQQAAAAEEDELLNFASNLDWDAFVLEADDAELAAALEALQDAEQKRTQQGADPTTERAWKKSFVTAVNHLVMKKAAAATATSKAAPGGAGGGVEGLAGRAAADAAAGDQDDVHSMISRISALSKAQSQASKASRAAAGIDQQSAAGAPAWNKSVKDPQETAAAADAAAGAKAAEEFLYENRELKGVHSLNSVRALLQRLQLAASQKQ